MGELLRISVSSEWLTITVVSV